MPATLQWYEGDNVVSANGVYPGDDSALKDLERMVGDMASGRRFTDSVIPVITDIAGSPASTTDVLQVTSAVGLLVGQSVIVGSSGVTSHDITNITDTAITVSPPLPAVPTIGDTVRTLFIGGTTPDRTQSLTTLQRSEDALIEWLATGGYVTVVSSYATRYGSPFRTLLEARAALAAVRLLSTRPTHERDAVLDDETGRRRIDGFAYQVRVIKAEILNGTFPLPRNEGTGSGPSVGYPPPRDPSFTFELEV